MSKLEWLVGDVAAATGVSVRTLHHYEHVGLLTPSRTDAGHRRYSERDVRRLTQIVALRSLGLPLAVIGSCVDDDIDALEKALRQQLAHVEQEIAIADQLRARLLRVLSQLTDASSVDSRELFELMEETTTMSDYYSNDDLAFLAARREELGEDHIRETQKAWPKLAAQMEAARLAGKDPGDAEVQGLAARWVELVEEFTGGDESVQRGLTKMYQTEGTARASRGVVGDETMAYAREAIAVLNGPRS